MFRLSFIITCVAVSLASCGGGGGGGGGGGTAAVVNQNANGYWSGSTSTPGYSSTPTHGLFNDGDFVAINGEINEFYKGSYTIDDDDISASAKGYYLNGPLIGTGTLSGVVNSKGTLKATVTANGVVSDLDLVYQTALSERSISLSDVAGSWSGYIPGLSFTISINSSGSFNASGSDGCNVSGTLSIPHSGSNMITGDLSVSGTYCNATGDYSGLGILADNVGTNDILLFGYANEQYGFGYAAARN